MSSRERCPRPREQPVQTWEVNLIDLRPVRLERSGQEWLERGEGNEVSGTGGVGWAAGRTLVLPSREGSGKGRP